MLRSEEPDDDGPIDVVIEALEDAVPLRTLSASDDAESHLAADAATLANGNYPPPVRTGSHYPPLAATPRGARALAALPNGLPPRPGEYALY